MDIHQQDTTPATRDLIWALMQAAWAVESAYLGGRISGVSETEVALLDQLSEALAPLASLTFR